MPKYIQPIPIGELKKLPPTDMPTAGKVWQPLEHSTLMDEVRIQGENTNWITSNPVVHLDMYKTELSATLDVTPDKPTGLPDGVGLLVGVLNSNSQNYAPLLMGGIKLPNGDKVILSKHKLPRHTTHFDTEVAVAGAWGSFQLAALGYGKAITHLQRKVLGEKAANALLLGAARKKLLPWKQLGLADKLFMLHDQTAWGLLQTFAALAHKGPTMKYLLRLYDFYNLLLT